MHFVWVEDVLVNSFYFLQLSDEKLASQSIATLLRVGESQLSSLHALSEGVDAL